MPLPRAGRRIILVGAALVLALSCDGNSPFGPPPDGFVCTRDTLEVGVVHQGAVDDNDCVLTHGFFAFESPAESWMLNARANKAYIVRMRPVAGANAQNTFTGDVALYRGNSAGDPVFATGHAGTWGSANVNGGFSHELVFTSAKDQTLSLRVQSSEEEVLGAYTIQVLTCPLVTLAPGETSAPVAFEADCMVEAAAGSTTPTRVEFFQLEANAFEDIGLTATRTSGSAEMQLAITGPDLDGSCWIPGCVGGLLPQGVGPIELTGIMPKTAHYTVALFKRGTGGLTATLKYEVLSTP